MPSLAGRLRLGDDRTTLELNDRLPAKYAELVSTGSTQDVRMEVDTEGLTFRIQNHVSKGSTIRGVENLFFSLSDGTTHHNDLGMPEYSRFLEWDKREQKVSRRYHTGRALGDSPPNSTSFVLWPRTYLSVPTSSRPLLSLPHVLIVGAHRSPSLDYPVCSERSLMPDRGHVAGAITHPP